MQAVSEPPGQSGTGEGVGTGDGVGVGGVGGGVGGEGPMGDSAPDMIMVEMTS